MVVHHFHIISVQAGSGKVQVGERVGPVQGVQQGLDPADEIGRQRTPVAAGEALGATGPVGADGHGAMLPEPGRPPRQPGSDEEMDGFAAALFLSDNRDYRTFCLAKAPWKSLAPCSA